VAYTPFNKGVKRLLRAIDRRTLSDDELAGCLREAGIVHGATVMVHCSIGEVMRRVPSMNAVRLVELMQRLLGADGTLLVPNSPFSGFESHFVHSHDTFDVRRTPSKVGLYTEVFRRMPGVTRSMHPTHAVAGWGKNAAALLATHHLGTAFGENSPFCKLRDYGGRVVGIGVRMGRSFTIFHGVEELHPRTRKTLFEETPYHMNIINGAQVIPYTSFALRTGITRNVVDVEDALRADGTLRTVVRKGLRFESADAKALIERGLGLIERGIYILPGAVGSPRPAKGANLP
jgi:aminoglycoside 3-N-acetyltransferase